MPMIKAGKIQITVQTQTFLVGAVLFFSFFCKLAYLFYFSGYKGCLVSDMSGYWSRANERYAGDISSVFQWNIEPPLFHLILFQLFKVFSVLHAFEWRLEAALVLFSVLSTVSTYFVCRISEKITQNFAVSFWVTLLYAFSFPILYYNSLLLSENIATPLAIAATFLVLTRYGEKFFMLLAGILLGIAVGVRPIFGFVGLPFFLYIITSGRASFRIFARGICFCFGFFLVLFLVLVENNYISKGQVRGLAAVAGFNFFTEFCKPGHTLTSYYGGRSYADNAVLASDPRYGTFITDRPYHDQNYFRGLAFDCIRENPSVWLDNFKFIARTFTQFRIINPNCGNAKGVDFWFPYFNVLTLVFSISIGLFFLVMPKDRLFLKQIVILLSPFFATLLTGYFFVVDMRYLVPPSYGLYIAFFAMIPFMVKKWKKSVIYYAVLLAAIGIFSGYQHLNQRHLSKVFHVASIQKFPLERAGKRKPDAIPGDQMGMFILPDLQSAVLLESKTPRTANKIEISTDSWDSYNVEFYLNEKLLGEILLPLARPSAGGIYRRILPMPDSLNGKKFNQILVRPVEGDGIYSLAYLILDPVISSPRNIQ